MITLEVRKKRLVYSFSRSLSIELFNKNQLRISAKLKDTPTNRIKAEGVVSAMKLDYLAKQFDQTLTKYGLGRQVVVEPEKTFTWQELVQEYLSFKVLADSTRKSQEQRFLSVLTQSGAQNPNQLFQWVKANRSSLLVRRFVSFMRSATDWAILLGRSPFGDHNPFIGMAIEAKNLPKPVRQPKKGFIPREGVDHEEFEDCRAFTVAERETIIQAFLQSSYCFLVAFITFLFLTGCRPGEGCEARWKDVQLNLLTRTGRIKFSRSYSPETRKVKSTKTGQVRKFPIRDPRLFDLLLSLRPEKPDPEALVFTQPDGRRISIRALSRIWGSSNYSGKTGIVLKLANEGKIRTYLTLYSCRHTFITLQLFAGPKNVIVPLAKWVGNSPTIIFKHYADMPEDVFPVAV